MRKSACTFVTSLLAVVALVEGEAFAGVNINASGTSGPFPGLGIFPAAERYSFEVDYENTTAIPHTIQSATYFFMARGGFMTGGPRPLATFPVTMQPGDTDHWTWSAIPGDPDGAVPTAERVVVRSVIDGDVRFTQIPLQISGYSSPSPLVHIETPLNLAINGPPLLVNYSDGTSSDGNDLPGVWIPAQLQVFEGTETPGTYEVQIFDAQGNRIVDDQGSFNVAEGTTVTPSGGPWPYTWMERFSTEGIELPLTLSITAVTLDDSGNSHTSSKTYTVEEPTVVDGMFPLHDYPAPYRVVAGNGPGEFNNIHSQSDLEEYAYDIGLADGAGSHYHGTGTSNSDYYVHGQPIYPVSPGTVVYVDDSHPENPVPGQFLSSPQNNVLVIQDATGAYQIYVHMIPGSSTNSAGLQVGSTVDQDQVIGNVGNAGLSTEPHLHLQSFILDAHGHPQAVPIQFDNLYQASTTRQITGVPMSSYAYPSTGYYDAR